MYAHRALLPPLTNCVHLLTANVGAYQWLDVSDLRHMSMDGLVAMLHRMPQLIVLGLNNMGAALTDARVAALLETGASDAQLPMPALRALGLVGTRVGMAGIHATHAQRPHLHIGHGSTLVGAILFLQYFGQRAAAAIECLRAIVTSPVRYADVGEAIKAPPAAPVMLDVIHLCELMQDRLIGHPDDDEALRSATEMALQNAGMRYPDDAVVQRARTCVLAWNGIALSITDTMELHPRQRAVRPWADAHNGKGEWVGDYAATHTRKEGRCRCRCRRWPGRRSRC
jgi:hypothetical protein